MGRTNATWPLAQLSATSDKISISIRLLGTYDFTSKQVLAVERYVLFPVVAWGIRIHHCNADCPQCVIFWYLGRPDIVLRGIRESGFLPTASHSTIPQYRGIAVRWSVIIIVVAIWIVLLFFNFARSHKVFPYVGPLILAPLLFLLVLTVGTLLSSDLQRIILKPGRSIGEIKPYLRLFAFIFGIMLVIVSILLAMK
jgi:hypothetical protein